MTRNEFFDRCGGRLQLDWDGVLQLLPGLTDRGIKSAIYRKTELAGLLRPHMNRIGRKVFFRTEGVGRALGLIDEAQP